MKEHKAIEVELPTKKSIVNDLKHLIDMIEEVDNEQGFENQKSNIIKEFMKLNLEKKLKGMTDDMDVDTKEGQEGTAIESTNDKVDNVISFFGFFG